MILSCYDGASNMSGTKKDAEARAVYTPTTSDTLNLAVGNTVKQSNLKSCMMLWIQP